MASKLVKKNLGIPGTSLTSVLVAIGVMGLLTVSGASAAKSAMIAKKPVRASAADADVLPIINGNVRSLLTDYIQGSCGGTFSSGSYPVGTAMSMRPASSISLTGSFSKDQAAAQARCSQTHLFRGGPGANSRGLYGCWTLNPKSGANAGKSSLRGAKNAFVELSVDFIDLKTGAPATCGSSGAASLGYRGYLTVYWSLPNGKRSTNREHPVPFYGSI